MAYLKLTHILLIVGAVLCVLVLGVFSFLFPTARMREAYGAYVDLAASERVGGDLVQGLLEIHEAYPELLEPKVDLGSFYLSQGDMEKAGLYLSAGERMVGESRNRAYKYLLYCNLAERSYMRGEFATSVSYAKKAKRHDRVDERAIGLVEANALAQDGRVAEALRLYRAYRQTGKEFLRPEDWRRYILLLQQNEKYDECISELEAYVVEAGYFAGAGQIASSAWEKKGNISQALIYAYLDYEFLQGLMDAPRDQMRDNVRRLGVELESKGMLGDPSSRMTLEGLSFLVENDFGKARERFLSNPPFSATAGGKYLLLKTETKEGRMDMGSLQTLKDLESRFRTFVQYYETLGEALGQMTPQDTLGRAACYERILGLTDYQPTITEARSRIARIMGVDGALAETFITPFDCRRIVASYSLNPDQKVFDRVFASLELPRNPYQDLCIDILREAMGDPGIYSIFVQRQGSAKAGLAQKLAMITGEAR